MIVATNLAKELRANQTYNVLGPDEVREILQSSGQRISDTDYKKQAQVIKQTVNADAFIVGSVIQDTILQTEYYAYGEDGYNNFPFEYGYENMPYESEWYAFPGTTALDTSAYVVVRSSMIDTSSGTVICQTPGAIEGSSNIRALGDEKRQQASDEAVEDTVKKLEYQFSVVGQTVKIQSNFLRTATKNGDRWHYTNSFKASDNEIYAVIKLPPEAALNDFKLTITNGMNKVISSKDFTWYKGDDERGINFPIKQLSQLGKGKYSVNLYTMDNLIISRSISIKD